MPRAGAGGVTGGSVTTTKDATADTTAMARGIAKAAASPYDCANSGMVMAATAAPTGCDICRIPIASPRRRGGNHPTTRRPLAEFPEAVADPVSSRNTAIAPKEWVNSSAVSAQAAATDPATRTSFSLVRSTSQPQAMSVRAMPTEGIATSIPERESDMPISVVK